MKKTKVFVRRNTETPQFDVVLGYQVDYDSGLVVCKAPQDIYWIIIDKSTGCLVARSGHLFGKTEKALLENFQKSDRFEKLQQVRSLKTYQKRVSELNEWIQSQYKSEM